MDIAHEISGARHTYLPKVYCMVMNLLNSEALLLSIESIHDIYRLGRYMLKHFGEITDFCVLICKYVFYMFCVISLYIIMVWAGH